MSSKEVIRRLKKESWIKVRTKGSHWQFSHSIIKRIVTVPHPEKDLTIGTYKSICRQAGWDN